MFAVMTMSQKGYNQRNIKLMKMTTIDWVVREERLKAFYGGDVDADERLHYWRISGKLVKFLQLYPRLATQSRRVQLWHIETYFIHAPAEVDEIIGADVATNHSCRV
jgi:hypothetical protein